MITTTFWRLTIHYWGRAVEAGLRPEPTYGFPSGEQYYKPHSIDFDEPPSREEFTDIVSRMPWMSAAWQNLLAILPSNPWPMISYATKAATVELHDGAGQCVGRLEVYRQERWHNGGYNAPFIESIHCHEVTRRLKRRDEAYRYLDAHSNTIMERVAKVPNWTDATVKNEIERMLVEGGFKRRKAG